MGNDDLTTEEIYMLQKDGELNKKVGNDFIERQKRAAATKVTKHTPNPSSNENNLGVEPIYVQPINVTVIEEKRTTPFFNFSWFNKNEDEEDDRSYDWKNNPVPNEFRFNKGYSPPENKSYTNRFVALTGAIVISAGIMISSNWSYLSKNFQGLGDYFPKSALTEIYTGSSSSPKIEIAAPKAEITAPAAKYTAPKAGIAASKIIAPTHKEYNTTPKAEISAPAAKYTAPKAGIAAHAPKAKLTAPAAKEYTIPKAGIAAPYTAPNLPPKATVKKEEQKFSTYLVKPGDSMWRIAKNNGIDPIKDKDRWHDFCIINGKDPYTNWNKPDGSADIYKPPKEKNTGFITVGQKIKILSQKIDNAQVVEKDKKQTAPASSKTNSKNSTLHSSHNPLEKMVEILYHSDTGTKVGNSKPLVYTDKSTLEESALNSYTNEDLNKIISMKNSYNGRSFGEITKKINAKYENKLADNNLEKILKKIVSLKATDPNYRDLNRINFDYRLADEQMKTDIVNLYSRSDKSINAISKELSSEYGMNVSASTISRYARNELDVKNRREARTYAVAEVAMNNNAVTA